LFLEAALEDAGFNVMTAENGHEAYNRVKERQPDFITLDLVMPKQSGALFYIKLRKNQNWQSIPVMIISAHAHDEMGQEDYQTLMKGKDPPRPDFFMEKPVQPEEVIRVIGTALDVDVSAYTDEATEDARGEIMSQLKGADLDTLQKVRNVLKDE
jgi:CheY-like chemotaxis protein